MFLGGGNEKIKASCSRNCFARVSLAFVSYGAFTGYDLLVIEGQKEVPYA